MGRLLPKNARKGYRFFFNYNIMENSVRLHWVPNTASNSSMDFLLINENAMLYQLKYQFCMDLLLGALRRLAAKAIFA